MKKVGREGQLIAIMPLVMALGVGGVLMWNYNRNLQGSSAGIRDRMDLDRFAGFAVRKIERLLKVRDTSGTAACVALNAGLDPVRDLTIPASEWAPPVVDVTLPLPAWMSCIYPAEALNELTSSYSPVRSLEFHVRTVGNTGWENLSRTVEIVIYAIGSGRGTPGSTRVTGSTNQAISTTLKQTVRLQAASLSRYALVLRAGGAAPQIVTAVGGASVVVSGMVFLEGGGSIDQVVNHAATTVTFNKSVDIQASNLSFNANLDLGTLMQVYKGGIRTGIFNKPGTILPYKDGVQLDDPTQSDGDYWNQSLVSKADPGATFLQPRAILNAPGGGAKQINPGTNNFNSGSITIDTSKVKTSYLPAVVAPMSTAGYVPPVPPYNNPYFFWKNDPQETAPPLRQTCKTSVAADNRVWVFMDNTANLTIGAAELDDGSGPSEINSLCALILADQVTFNLPAGVTARFYGQIIAHRITVNGPASSKLIFANPADNIAIGTTDQSQILLRMQERASGVAHNFFVPILNLAPNYFAAPIFSARYVALRFNYKSILPYRAHGALVPPGFNPAVSTWKPTAGAPLSTWTYAADIPKVGYMFLCIDELGGPSGFQFFCPLGTTTTVTPAEKQADLAADIDGDPTTPKDLAYALDFE